MGMRAKEFKGASYFALSTREFKGAPYAATPLWSLALFLSMCILPLALAVLSSKAPLTPARCLHLFFISLVIPAFYGAIFAVVAIRTRITVGADGILLRWFHRSQFIPVSQIASAEPDGTQAIRLQLTSGKIEMIHTGKGRPFARKKGSHRDDVLFSIMVMLAMRAESPVSEPLKVAVPRTRRVEAGYRDQAVRHEELWRTIEDPRASEEDRAAAAVLLQQSLDDTGRERLRIAATATASPALRVMLDAAADESIDDAESALQDFRPSTQERLGVLT